MKRKLITRTKPILRSQVVSQRASAETVGAVVLLAVVVTAISVASIAILNPEPIPDDPPTADMVVETRAGSDALVLTRLTGLPLDLGELAVAVDIDDVRVFSAPAGETGVMWALGQPLVVGPLPAGIEPGQRVEVSLISRTGSIGSLMTTTRVHTGALAEAGPAPAPSVVAVSGEAGTQLRATQSLLAEAIVDHPGGRKMIQSVTGQVSGIGSLGALHDDGTLGDRIAGDGRYASSFTVPVGTLPGTYPIIFTVKDLWGTEVTTHSYVHVLPTPPPSGQFAAAFGEGGGSGTGGSGTGGLGDGGTGGIDDGSGPLDTSGGSTSTSGVSTGGTSGTGTTTTTSAPTTTTTSAPPSFTILPGGGVSALCAEPVRIWIVGSQITYGAGGPAIPVKANFTQNGGSSYTPLFGGLPVVAGNTATFNVPAGSVLGVRGSADYLTFHSAYSSFSNDPHVKVLKDGDAPPSVLGFAGQTSVATFLAPYLQNGLIHLAPNQVIMLFEFNPSLTSTAADFQDLVVLLEFPIDGCSSAPAGVSTASVGGWIAPPGGGRYNLNVIGLENAPTANVTNSHVIFVPLTGTCRLLFVPGAFGVADRTCAGDGQAVLSLADAGYGGSDNYRVFLRVVGNANGMTSWSQCFTENGSTWCGASDLRLQRAGGSPVSTDASASLLSVCSDPDGDGVYTRNGLFSSASQGLYWDIHGNGQRIVQMRIYPVPAPAVPTSC